MSVATIAPQEQLFSVPVWTGRLGKRAVVAPALALFATGSRFKSLFVIARNSSFIYKGKAVDIKQVGRELGVGYVLEGSMRKAAGRVRITGQLIDTHTGAHLWADRFDGALADNFELQDKVTTSVVRAELGRRHDSFPTRYALNLYPGDPMRVPTSKLTMRVLRHTCITALHDAGCIREQIRAVTGHSMSSIDEILKRYTALTVDQAGTALARQNEHHERQKAGWTNDADVRHFGVRR